MRLAVELDNVTIGALVGDERTFDFVPAESAIDRVGMNSTALSVSIPLMTQGPSPDSDAMSQGTADLGPGRPG